MPVTPEGSGEPARVHCLPSSWHVRGSWLFAGVVLPFFCFLISYPEAPHWQSGKLEAYAQLLLSRKPSLAQYPFLLYSMACMTLLMLEPARVWNSTFVRFGIYTGILLASEYWLLFQLALGATDFASLAVCVTLSAAAVGAPCLLRWVLAGLFRDFGYDVVWGLAGLVTLPLLFFFKETVFLCVLTCLWCSTPWALAAYLAVSICLVRGGGAKRFQFSLTQLLLLFTWLSLHLGAWRISFTLMLKEYAELPTVAPSGCCVCSAAAKGHPGVVRSEKYLDPDGTAFRVNDQLRFLKAWELLLLSLYPRVHRLCRGIYDRVGPRLAAMLWHPLFADLGYILLKPAEWAARACLAVAIPGEFGLVRDLYRNRGR